MLIVLSSSTWFGIYVLNVAIMKVDSDVTSSARCWAQQQQQPHCDKHADRQTDMQADWLTGSMRCKSVSVSERMIDTCAA